MTRSLLALAALGSIGLGIAQADYILIKMNMGVAPAQAAQPGQPGAMMRPGFPGYPGYYQPQPIQPQIRPGEKTGPVDLGIPLTVIIPLEYSKMTPVPVAGLPQGAGIAKFHHKWGDSFVYTDNKFIQIAPGKTNEQGMFLISPIKRATTLQMFEKKKQELAIARNKSAEANRDLALFALEHGLYKICNETLDELVKQESKDANVTAAIKAVTKVRADLANPVSRDDPAILWKRELNYKEDRSAPHYVLLYDTTAPSEVKSRLARLEANMEAFYLWFALHGKALPVPDRRMVVALIEKPTEFWQTYTACGRPGVVADGFFGRRDNLVVCSAAMLDPVAEPLGRRFTELIGAGWDLGAMMRPKFKMSAKLAGTPPAEIAQVYTMALIKRTLEEESELATVSHQGTRQLLATIGMLPRSVEIPEWVQFGWPAFFETPKFDSTTSTVAFWPGTGAPSWTYLVQWKLWEMDKQLEEPVDGLMGVLTDEFFRDARRSPNPELMLKARTYAWALAYFLAQRDLDGLLRYGNELSLLPRDLEFDGDVHLGCFARAFKIDDPSKPNGVNSAKLEALAKDWYKFIQIAPMQMPELLPEAQKVYKERQKAMGMKPAQ